MDEEIEKSLGVLCRLFNMDLATLLLRSDKSGSFRVSHEWKSRALKRPGFKNTVVKNSFPWLERMLELGESIEIYSIDDFPRLL